MPAVEIEPHVWEFDCVECGRHIISLQTWEPTFCLCGMCIMMPGWYDDPRLREVLDPEYKDEPK